MFLFKRLKQIFYEVIFMKYCAKCGKELLDEAIICMGCGCSTEPTTTVIPQTAQPISGLQMAAKILMIIGTVIMGLYIIPLAWCLPITLSYCKKLKNNEPVSTGFKVCSLLFVSLIGGILMLCDNN